MATKDEIREAILQAAERLFLRFGPVKTTVADIARELGMSSTNIYNFYRSRDEILEAVGTRHLSDLKDSIILEMSLTKDKWSKIEILFLRTMHHMRDHLENEKNILQLQAIEKKNNWHFVVEYYDFMRAAVSDIMQSGVAEGDLLLNPGRLAQPAVTDAARAVFDCMQSAWDPLMVRKFNTADHERRVRIQLTFLRFAFQS